MIIFMERELVLENFVHFLLNSRDTFFFFFFSRYLLLRGLFSFEGKSTKHGPTTKYSK